MSAPLFTDKPTIKILLYTDDPRVSQSASSDEFFGLGSMIARLKAHAPVFAALSPTWVSRNSSVGNHADNKIDVVLSKELERTGEPFDEIWFFGLHQANTDQFSLGVASGGPKSELDEGEVLALQDWMKGNEADGSAGGGVLITGDHSEEPPEGTVLEANHRCPGIPDGQAFLGLGRAIGRCVPRAGLLRKWEGEPTNRAIDSFDTIAASGLQVDGVPQELFLTNVNAAGDPDPNGQPHPLFLYQPGQFIKVFPDHGHEGAVIIPNAFDEATWPVGANGQPRPHVVASGTNQRTSESLNIIATYNGDLANVGRIVADSTWHHYMNLNLTNFPHPAQTGSVSDQIGQFYGNLAVWLAPRRKRVQMGHAMLSRVADYTLVVESRADMPGLSKAAHSILARVASPCEIHEAMQAVFPEQFEVLSLPDNSKALNHLPFREMVLGYLLDSYHQEMIRAASSVGLAGADFKPLGVEQVLKSGFRMALREHTAQVQQTLAALKTADFK